MAWKTPAGQRKPPKQQAKKNGDTSFPGLASPGPEATRKTQYEELQQNEVMVLQAIYAEDFTEHKATHSAWKVGQMTIRPGRWCDLLTRIPEIRAFV